MFIRQLGITSLTEKLPYKFYTYAGFSSSGATAIDDFCVSDIDITFCDVLEYFPSMFFAVGKVVITLDRTPFLPIC